MIQSDEIMKQVKPIMQKVREHGDAALLELTSKFDKVELSCPVLKAPFNVPTLPQDIKNAIDQAYDNIYTFHQAQLDTNVLRIETMPGVVCSRFSRPIQKVGLYVPGGTAILPSTTLSNLLLIVSAGCSCKSGWL